MGALMQLWWMPLMLSAAVTAVGLWLLLSRLSQFALDTPNHRSLHEVPVPRTGGWAILGGVSVGILVAGVDFSAGAAIAFFLLLAVSLADDLRSLSARFRFVAQISSVTLLSISLEPELSHWLLWIPLVVTGVWVVNLYNFMDGMDGFAGSMSAIGFGALGLICLREEAGELAGICFLLAASSVVFLYYNWPQARIFMGDAGSTVIGLAVFAVSTAGWQRGVFDLVVPLLIFLPFWLDATLTLLARGAKGERWWEPHRQHLYQRAALKLGVKTALFLEMTVMLCTSAAALLLVIFGLV
ncbi:glycosyltransferase family 4 protein [Microbulbifer harenosus]|uniref:Glycosyltransferase family 4 protein n=2 Tax=Microbulbifer harenosus TaxID=2576840 RepID=A0ABY2UNM1_9GAMM|nr:glycosyltransferase family 4 protein [Microbulbifer harenosus]